jgi:hypothetical protein
MDNHSENPEQLAPWYLNQTLTAGEKESYEAWLEANPGAKEDLHIWQGIRQAVGEQPRPVPAAGLLQQTKARIQAARVEKEHSRWTWQARAGGIATMVLVFVLLWGILKPVTTLRWSIYGNVPATFKLYRAPEGSQDYRLIREIPARENQYVYVYNDLLSVPGRAYQYRVEGFNHSGVIMSSQAVISNPRTVLPGQLSILLTSMIMGYVCLSLLKGLPGPVLRPSDGAVA